MEFIFLKYPIKSKHSQIAFNSPWGKGGGEPMMNPGQARKVGNPAVPPELLQTDWVVPLSPSKLASTLLPPVPLFGFRLSCLSLSGKLVTVGTCLIMSRPLQGGMQAGGAAIIKWKQHPVSNLKLLILGRFMALHNLEEPQKSPCSARRKKTTTQHNPLLHFPPQSIKSDAHPSSQWPQ